MKIQCGASTLNVNDCFSFFASTGGAGVGGNSAMNGGLADAATIAASKPSVAEMASKSRVDG